LAICPAGDPLALRCALLHAFHAGEDEDDAAAAAYGRADEAIARLLGMPGLDAVGAEVLIEQRIAVALLDAVIGEVLLGLIVIVLREVLDQAARQGREIARRHIVVGCRQAVNGGEVAVGETKLLRR